MKKTLQYIYIYIQRQGFQDFCQKLMERRKLVYNFLLKWSKGGSRELLEVSTLSRDLVC